jgi:hypothetical protein
MYLQELTEWTDIGDVLYILAKQLEVVPPTIDRDDFFLKTPMSIIDTIQDKLDALEERGDIEFSVSPVPSYRHKKKEKRCTHTLQNN